MVNAELVVDVKPCDFSVVIGYQVDEFTHMCELSASLLQVVRITLLWTKQSKTLRMVLILASWTLLMHQNWMFPLMRQMSCLPQSLQGFYVWLGPILIMLACSLILA